MLQYKIPQNVGIEDKIVGPLTLRQLIILAGGGGLSYTLFLILSKVYELNFIEYGVIAVPGLIAAAAALIRINDLSFPQFILLTLEYNLKPKKRLWDHRGIASLVAPDLEEVKPRETETEISAELKRKNVNLSQLSQILDSGGFNHVSVKEHPDLDRARDEDLIAQAFFGQKVNQAQQMYWRSAKHDGGRRLELLAKLPVTPLKKPAEPVKAVTTAETTPAVTPPTLVIPTKPAPPSPKPLQTLPIKPVTPPVVIPKTSVSAPFPPEVAKKKRQRRKKKRSDLILRPETHVNTLQKNQPVQFVPKPPAPPPPSPKKEKTKGGEFEFHELEKGEIEINLD